jgi:hypothetical protein
LGTPLGNVSLSTQEYEDLKEYQETAEDYGVELCLSQMQYHTLHEAIVDAAEELDAHVVFATLPPMRLRLWRRFLLWQMSLRLFNQHRWLYTLEPPEKQSDWTPSISIPSTK